MKQQQEARMQIIYNIKKQNQNDGGSDYDMQILRKGKPFATAEQQNFVEDLRHRSKLIQEQLDREQFNK